MNGSVESMQAILLRLHAPACWLTSGDSTKCSASMQLCSLGKRPYIVASCLHLQINCGQSAGRVRLNASAAPEWSAALDIGELVVTSSTAVLSALELLLDQLY